MGRNIREIEPDIARRLGKESFDSDFHSFRNPSLDSQVRKLTEGPVRPPVGTKLFKEPPVEIIAK